MAGGVGRRAGVGEVTVGHGGKFGSYLMGNGKPWRNLRRGET